ncbi:hypothetical protein C7330_0589 [Pectobacterium versatile]|nr:hypothetical protein C7330_0589 [Pectobacterium versatile]
MTSVDRHIPRFRHFCRRKRRWEKGNTSLAVGLSRGVVFLPPERAEKRGKHGDN